MRLFEIDAHVYGTYEMEDPNGPSYWRGSGVYTVDVPYVIKVTCYVYAESEDVAVDLVENYEFTEEEKCPYSRLEEITDVQIESVSDITDEGDEDQPEEKVFEVYYVSSDPIVDDRDYDERED